MRAVLSAPAPTVNMYQQNWPYGDPSRAANGAGDAPPYGAAQINGMYAPYGSLAPSPPTSARNAAQQPYLAQPAAGQNGYWQQGQAPPPYNYQAAYYPPQQQLQHGMNGMLQAPYYPPANAAPGYGMPHPYGSLPHPSAHMPPPQQPPQQQQQQWQYSGFPHYYATSPPAAHRASPGSANTPTNRRTSDGGRQPKRGSGSKRGRESDRGSPLPEAPPLALLRLPVPPGGAQTEAEL